MSALGVRSKVESAGECVPAEGESSAGTFDFSTRFFVTDEESNPDLPTTGNRHRQISTRATHRTCRHLAKHRDEEIGAGCPVLPTARRTKIRSFRPLSS